MLNIVQAGIGTVSGAAAAIGLTSLLASVTALLGALGMFKDAEWGQHAGYFVLDVVAVALPIGALIWLFIWARVRAISWMH